MTPAQSHQLATAVNALNYSRGRRAEAAADFLVAIVIAALGIAALLHFALPCNPEGALCMAAVLHTRTPWPQRLLGSLHAAWLRHRIASARQEIKHMEEVIYMAHAELAYLPPRIAAHEAWITGQQATLQRLLTGTAH